MSGAGAHRYVFSRRALRMHVFRIENPNVPITCSIYQHFFTFNCGQEQHG